MIDYLYDGTFEGVLTCIYHNYYTEKASAIYERSEYQANLINGYMEVETDAEKATTVYEAIESKISGYALKAIYRAFLSCDVDKATKILKYVVLGFGMEQSHGSTRGYEINSLHGNPIVHDIDVLTKKVGVEQERMLEFVRFSVMHASEEEQEILYAEIEPDNDVLELVAYHFADRFKHDPLIIKDMGREKAIIAHEGHWYVSKFEAEPCTRDGVVSFSNGRELLRSDDEIEYRKLWKTYFDHIAIMERKNPRCQKNFMPVRYWKNLTEML